MRGGRFEGDPARAGETDPLAAALRAAVDPTVVLRRIVDQAMALIPRAEASVVEIATEDHLSYVCAAGTLGSHVGVRLELEGSLSGRAIRSGRVMVCTDTSSDERVDRRACQEMGITSMVCVPLRRASGPVGVLKVTSSQPAAFSPPDVEVLTRLSEFVTNAVAAATDTSRAVAQVLAEQGADPYGCSESDSIAEFVANVTQPGLAADTASRTRVQATLAEGAFDIVVQPIFDLASAEMVSVEALCRFRSVPYRPPDVCFAEAQRVGLGRDLELAVLRRALAALEGLPEGIRLAVNASADTITSDAMMELVEAAGPQRTVIELTEHLRVQDYPGLNRRLEPLRRQGAWLAVDDTGAGVSSLTHILKLAPEIIKLDRYLSCGVDIDPVRRALASALVTFASDSGARVVAEGIETPEELRTLCSLGVQFGQGYHLGRPGPVSERPAAAEAAALAVAAGRSILEP